ncbi:Carbonic anhydrase 2 [Amphibalanus amphitrite]|uniref:carbonic anhydrase n=1 Tax=Amphibalanus amphitrite TaxID=1232801 RepID=A0A6A4WYW4_AMPAM|nr:carbonic anhydrase 2-like [Amphibalanus amphitrite]KAF0312135.1 Carbonic anhydrase 2 [Amphibalanus amphitrite]
MVLPWWTLLLYLRNARSVPPTAYNYTAPETWQETFPMCGGPMQSPIALTPNRLKIIKAPALQFADHLENGMIEAENTGREIKLKLLPPNPDESLLNLFSFDGETLGIYEFAQMHFHWGDVRLNHGSEHAIGDKFTDAEAHFVFYNSRYDSFKEAARRFDGLLVIGVLLKGTEDESKGLFPTLGIEKQMKAVSSPGKKLRARADLRPFQDVLRRAVKTYLSYHGSLTTPPCNPVVTWMVASKPMFVSYKFLETLTTNVYEDDDGMDLLVNNCRPLQPRHKRVVTQFISFE